MAFDWTGSTGRRKAIIACTSRNIWRGGIGLKWVREKKFDVTTDSVYVFMDVICIIIINKGNIFLTVGIVITYLCRYDMFK